MNNNKEYDYFSNSKSSALRFAWFFCQFQPGVAYKSVVYKKSFIFSVVRLHDALELWFAQYTDVLQALFPLKKYLNTKTIQNYSVA